VESNPSPRLGASADRIFAGAIVLLAIALVWVVAGTLQDRVINAGDTAPDFKITGDDGKTYTRENFGGKVLVLNFWASWCAPCVQEAPSLQAFGEQLRGDGVVVLGVSIDTNEKRYKQFLQRFQIPETYVIDRTGKVREKIISNQNWVDPAFVSRVKALL
jgi:cytochrome c biogenesis protein CcmG/thiol:disulfide interchange protein DsbE